MYADTELTIDFHGITLKAEFDFYSDDLSVDIKCLTVIVDEIEVDEITSYITDDGMEEIEETIVHKYLAEQGLLKHEIDTALLLRRITANRR